MVRALIHNLIKWQGEWVLTNLKQGKTNIFSAKINAQNSFIDISFFVGHFCIVTFFYQFINLDIEAFEVIMDLSLRIRLLSVY